MKEQTHDAQRLIGVGIDHEMDSGIIFAQVADNTELHLSIPSSDIPELVTLLNQAWGELKIGDDNKSDLVVTQPVETANFSHRLVGGSLLLELATASGVDLNFEIDRDNCIVLFEQLKVALGES